MSLHAVLAPSSAAKRAACPGSRAMEAAYPETEPSRESLEGTAAHWAFAEILAGREIDTGLIAPNGIMLTDEMVEGAELFVGDIIQSTPAAEFFGYPLMVETPVSIATIHPECWGTPDAWIYKPGRLIVWDYKFGHRYVEVFENLQMVEYAAGILEQMGVNGIADQHTEVIFRIVQPRCYVGGAPIREWRTTASDLRALFNLLRGWEEAAMQNNAPCVVNEHCGDCLARHACPAAQRAAYHGMAIATSSVPFDLPPEALGVELRYVDRAIAALEARRTGLAEQALAVIKRGARVPLYHAEQGEGRERWKRPDAEIIALGDMLGIPLSKPKLITPKQAVKAGLDEATAKAFSETPKSEIALKPDNDTQARKVFSTTY